MSRRRTAQAKKDEGGGGREEAGEGGGTTMRDCLCVRSDQVGRDLNAGREGFGQTVLALISVLSTTPPFARTGKDSVVAHTEVSMASMGPSLTESWQ